MVQIKALVILMCMSVFCQAFLGNNRVSCSPDPQVTFSSDWEGGKRELNKRAPGWGKRRAGWGKRAPAWGKRSSYREKEIEVSFFFSALKNEFFIYINFIFLF